jgi:hypothetical protein
MIKANPETFSSITDNLIPLKEFAPKIRRSYGHLKNIAPSGKLPWVCKIEGMPGWYVDKKKFEESIKYPKLEIVSVPEPHINVLEIRDRVIAEMGIPPVRRGRRKEVICNEKVK